ncbi:MAG: FAD-binding protein, partial [bacterium]|nr:FAD-binding protein [bacterium]
MDLKERLQAVIQGEVEDDKKTLARYSRDASLFEVKPQVVVFPKDTDDLKALVKFVAEEKGDGRVISLTARSGGTDMTGGPLSESIIVDFARHFNRIDEIESGLPAVALAEAGLRHAVAGYGLAEAGVFYRDFEKENLKQNLLLPS